MAEADQDLLQDHGAGERKLGAAERDIIALGIAAAAIIMFIGTGSAVLPQVVKSLTGAGLGPDKVLVNALLLNIALVIFGWRRYRQLLEEIADRRKAEEQARTLAETDPLTGCLNRRSIGDFAERLVAAATSSECGAAALMIDLDNFKAVNDFYGHGAGDDVIRTSAHRISELLPEGARLARLGGDEFVAVLSFDTRRPGTLDDLAARIITSIFRPTPIAVSTVEITASIGIARGDFSTNVDAPTLLHMADIAMYNAKKLGRNRYSWFEAPMQDELRFSAEIETGIRRGIPLGEFVPYYERQVDVQTGRLTGFEMLTRWISPALGIVSPEIFIPVAERIGAIGEMSERVIRQALDDARRWDPSLTLAVNISPRQLRDPWFAQKLLKLLVSANFPPERLEIEITESCLHENVGVVRSLITSLKNQGIRVSLDDFGTGYSSIAQLRSLPFDRIKIDRSFISNIASSSDSAALVEGIALLGKGLGLPITAEGIENEEVLERLREFGNIKGQGYLYGRPQNAQAVRATLSEMGLLREDAIAAPDAEGSATGATPLRRTGSA